MRASSIHCEARLMFERGWRVTKFPGNLDPRFRANEPNDGVVMNRVSHAIGKLAPDIGIKQRRSTGVSDAGDGLTVPIERFRAPSFYGPQNIACGDRGEADFVLDARISAPRVVVNLPGGQAFDQTVKMLQHVTEV